MYEPLKNNIPINTRVSYITVESNHKYMKN